MKLFYLVYLAKGFNATLEVSKPLLQGNYLLFAFIVT